MRKAAVVLAVVLAGGVVPIFGDAHLAGNIGPGQAFGADDVQFTMPKEAIGFVGTLSGQVAKIVVTDKWGTWVGIKVVKVSGFSPGNKCKLSAEALTAVWKDKYANVRGVPGMPPLKVGDTVTVTAFQFEGHLRSTKVSKLDATAPSGETKAPPTSATPP